MTIKSIITLVQIFHVKVVYEYSIHTIHIKVIRNINVLAVFSLTSNFLRRSADLPENR